MKNIEKLRLSYLRKSTKRINALKTKHFTQHRVFHQMIENLKRFGVEPTQVIRDKYLYHCELINMVCGVMGWKDPRNAPNHRAMMTSQPPSDDDYERFWRWVSQ